MLNDQRQTWFGASTQFLGLRLIEWIDTLRHIGAFLLITLGVLSTKWYQAPKVVWPLVRTQIALAGIRLLPTITMIGISLGFVIIGQTVSLLSRVGATNLSGLLMVTVVVRELGPLAAALLVLGRFGTGVVIELGTARAMGEVEALEALGIDPIHYLVVPRLVGLTVSVVALTVYLILIAFAGGCLFGFLQEFPLHPSEYFRQIADALRWQDFLFLGLKTGAFGVLISLIICYHGLAQPLRLEEVSRATTRTVAQSVIACLLIDGIFIILYLLI